MASDLRSARVGMRRLTDVSSNSNGSLWSSQTKSKQWVSTIKFSSLYNHHYAPSDCRNLRSGSKHEIGRQPLRHEEEIRINGTLLIEFWRTSTVQKFTFKSESRCLCSPSIITNLRECTKLYQNHLKEKMAPYVNKYYFKSYLNFMKTPKVPELMQKIKSNLEQMQSPQVSC